MPISGLCLKKLFRFLTAYTAVRSRLDLVWISFGQKPVASKDNGIEGLNTVANVNICKILKQIE
jgi:hypothetical protein